MPVLMSNIGVAVGLNAWKRSKREGIRTPLTLVGHRQLMRPRPNANDGYQRPSDGSREANLGIPATLRYAWNLPQP